MNAFDTRKAVWRIVFLGFINAYTAHADEYYTRYFLSWGFDANVICILVFMAQPTFFGFDVYTDDHIFFLCLD